MSETIKIIKCEISPKVFRDLSMRGSSVKVYFKNSGQNEIPPGGLKVENIIWKVEGKNVTEGYFFINPIGIPSGATTIVQEDFYLPVSRLTFGQYFPGVEHHGQMPPDEGGIESDGSEWKKPILSWRREGKWTELKRVIPCNAARPARNLG